MTDSAIFAILEKLDSIDKSLSLIADTLTKLPVYSDSNGTYLRVKRVE